jgi:hypothetical protein
VWPQPALRDPAAHGATAYGLALTHRWLAAGGSGGAWLTCGGTGEPSRAKRRAVCASRQPRKCRQRRRCAGTWLRERMGASPGGQSQRVGASPYSAGRSAGLVRCCRASLTTTVQRGRFFSSGFPDSLDLLDLDLVDSLVAATRLRPMARGPCPRL